MSRNPAPGVAAIREWADRPDGALVAVPVGDLVLESGDRLDEATVSFQKWGRPNAAGSNIVVLLHALTGSSEVCAPEGGPPSAAGWWHGLVGPGAVVDTDHWCVVTPNAIGGCHGSTGPASPAPDGRPWGSRFPELTVRDLVTAERLAFSRAGIDRLALVTGGSLGGARALEWMLMDPDRVGRGLVMAVGPRASADQIGLQETQIAAIRADPDWRGGDYHGTGRSPRAGMAIARRIAQLSYRGGAELDDRFGNRPQPDEDPLNGGRYAITSYLEHQAAKFGRRFDPGSYVALTHVLNHHDVGRGRGGVVAALNACRVEATVVGIDSDRLFPLAQNEELARELGGCAEGLQVIGSRAGHDGFLTERAAVGGLLHRALRGLRR